MTQRQSRAIRLGPLAIGGGAPVMVQSMTNTDTRDVEATTAQIARLSHVIRIALQVLGERQEEEHV